MNDKFMENQIVELKEKISDIYNLILIIFLLSIDKLVTIESKPFDILIKVITILAIISLLLDIILKIIKWLIKKKIKNRGDDMEDYIYT